MAGHFPLLYSRERCIEGFTAWGDFSTYSLELGARVARRAKEAGKKIGFMLVADDRTGRLNLKLGSTATKAKKNMFYKARNGSNAILPMEFSLILLDNGFSEADIIRSDHHKPGRNSCLYISETILAASSSRETNGCAKAYSALLESPYFNPSTDYFVSFVPDRCMGNVCSLVLESMPVSIASSHIFMQTDNTLFNLADRSGIWEHFGVLYRKDG